MAVLWADGFEHYGTNNAFMLDGIYAEAGSAPSAAQASTGTYSLYVNGSDNSTQIVSGFRKVLPAAVTKVGAMGHFFFPTLPNCNDGAVIFNFLTTDPTRGQITATVDGNGAIRFTRGVYFGFNGGVGTLIAQTTPLVTSNAFTHIEIQVYSHATLGWVRVAINGVHRYEATSLNTLYDATGIASIASHRAYYGSSAGTYESRFYIDNLIIYDFTGTPAVDTDFAPTVDGAGKATNYIGELQCMYLAPNGDTASAAWSKSSGTVGYSLINDITPDDTSYIQSLTAADLSEFDLVDLPVQITYIRGVMLLGRTSKSDSGAAETRFGFKSAAAVTDSPTRPITTIPTYWWDFINLDPNTAARWTRVNLNAAKLRLTRSV